MINNEYTIKQYIMLMCVHTYSLHKWNTVGCDHNIIIVDIVEKNNDY